MTQTAEVQDPHEQWLKELNDKVRGPHGMRAAIPRHVLERTAALLGDEAKIDWVESTVRYASREEGDGLVGTLAIFGEQLLVIAELQNVDEQRWAGAPDKSGPVTVRMFRRADLEGIEVPAADNGVYRNGTDAWSGESGGTWRSGTTIKLTYRDGTLLELGGDYAGDLLPLLPSLRDDLLA